MSTSGNIVKTTFDGMRGETVKPLREWRIDRILSYRQLAELSGVTPKTLVDIEHGKRLAHYETIRKVSAALNVAPLDVTEFANALEERGKDAA